MIEAILASQTLRLIALLAIFAVVMIISFLVLQAINRRTAQRSGLVELQNSSAVASLSSDVRKQKQSSAWAGLVKRIEEAGINLGDSQEGRLRQKLKAAGYTSPSAPRIYTLVRLLLVFLLPGLFLLLVLSRPEPPGFMSLYIFGSVLGLMGLYGPALFITAKAERRRDEVVNGFPDALDLILVCMEAGLGVDSALDRVTREIAVSHPLVAEILGTAVLQIRAGASREEAFRKMAHSTGVDEINSFATLLVQSDKLGTSIATTLRVYAEEMREKRRMRAEEKAHRLPVLIAIPLVVFMLPTMIGVVMLPAGVRMVRDIFPMMTGG